MNNNIVDNLSLVLQVLSLQILFDDCNNTDLMQELQRQDNEYFKKIIENQNEILNLLRKEDNNAREVREEN
jgi:hypothetical protein